MAKDRDPPISEVSYGHGVTVIDIGDIRVSRGRTRRPYSSCGHRRLSYDTQERRIWCRDCEREVEPFDAFERLVEAYARAHAQLQKRREELEQVENFRARSLAARQMDKAWQKRKTVPACPHCHQGLLPEDFKHGIRMTVSRRFAEKQRERKGLKK